MSNRLKTFRSIPYTAQTQNWVLPGGSKMEFKGWVPILGSDGARRNIIDGFEVHVQANLTVTVAGVLLADAWRIIDSFTVEQVDGTKRYDEIFGDALRMASYQYLGAERTREQYAIAVGATQALTFSFYVPLMKPYEASPYQFSMPAEAFRLVRIGMARASNMSLGTSVVVINSATYWVVADCHDEPKGQLNDYAIDQVTVNDFTATSQKQITVNVTGRPRDMLMYCPGAGGGQLFTSITAPLVTNAQLVGIDQQSMLLYPDITTRYAKERAYAPALYGTTNQSPIRMDPFVPDPADGSTSNAATNPRAVALMLCTNSRNDEGPVVDNIVLNLIETAAPPGNLRLVTRCIVPRNPVLTNLQMTKWKRTKATPITLGTPALASDGPYFAAALHT